MATVFVVKNRAPHGRKPFFADEEPEFTAIPKECALLLTKQYHTITPFPDQDKKDDSCLLRQPRRVFTKNIILSFCKYPHTASLKYNNSFETSKLKSGAEKLRLTGRCCVF